MAKITTSERNAADKKRDTVVVKTRPGKIGPKSPSQWWLAKTETERCQGLVATAAFLKDNQIQRLRQASMHARLYGNIPLMNFVGSNFTNLSTSAPTLPMDRPTMNVVQSCTDTLVSRIGQSRPRPLFLTDNGNYKKRNLAKQMNNFISGEFYQTKLYEMGETILKDAAVLGSGALKIYEQDDKVCVERRLITELYVDPNDAFYGAPRTMYELKLVDREVLLAQFPKFKDEIKNAEAAYPDNSGDSARSVADQIMVVESWRLPSGTDTEDGMHAIACSSGMLLEEPYTKKDFPFVFFHYSPRMVGFWGQGLAEQLIGTQVEINKLLITISQSISLVGVPRVFVEAGSKVVKAQLNNQVGSIVTYQGTKPEYEIAPCVPAELYQQLQRLVDYAYQQSGISALAAASTKPAGLNSGEALRNYDDLQSDRFATLNKRYNRVYEEAAYKIIECAKDIVERTGKYQTVYPNKDGTRQIDLPKVDIVRDAFVIQCYDTSSLPKDPAGRLQRVTEMIQAGMIDIQEGRRLLEYPDLQQVDKLAVAAEERILQQLDKIVEDADFTPPDPFTDLLLAKKLCTQYYNLYMAANLEEEKAEMLRDYQKAVLMLEAAAMPPAPPPMPGAPTDPSAQLAVPQPLPVSDLLPQ